MPIYEFLLFLKLASTITHAGMSIQDSDTRNVEKNAGYTRNTRYVCDRYVCDIILMYEFN